MVLEPLARCPLAQRRDLWEHSASRFDRDGLRRRHASDSSRATRPRLPYRRAHVLLPLSLTSVKTSRPRVVFSSINSLKPMQRTIFVVSDLNSIEARTLLKKRRHSEGSRRGVSERR